ncbi:MAG TPA: hypothetical protein VIU12_27430 [Chryseolinea sp.]
MTAPSNIETLKHRARKNVARNDVALLEHSNENTWRSFYALTEHWKSDVTFVDNELNFFRKLMFDYFARRIDGSLLEQMRKLSTQETKIEKRRVALEERILDQNAYLARFIENPFASDAHACKDEQEALENDFAEFIKDFRQFKQNLFTVTTEILKSEKGRTFAAS